MIIQHQVFVNGQNTDGWQEAVDELAAWVRGVYQSEGGRKLLQRDRAYRMMSNPDIKESYLDMLAELRAERAKLDAYMGLLHIFPQQKNGIPIVRKNPSGCIVFATVNVEQRGGRGGYEVADKNPLVVMVVEDKQK